jgi:hypothetical protein
MNSRSNSLKDSPSGQEMPNVRAIREMARTLSAVGAEQNTPAKKP